MGRRRKKGRQIHGWLILDKPYDFGSTEAVSKLRWLFDANKAGHAGTLDPLATGILPIAFGEATKTVPFVQDGLKTYRFTAKWGATTSTDDREGDILATSDIRPDRATIEAILPDFVGEIDQIPPAFSAIKVDGERAYDLAREGIQVTLESRQILIEKLSIIDMPSKDETIFEAVTGKGTYVRSLVRDIAKRLSTEGHVSQLRRIAVGPFTEASAATLEQLTGEVKGDVAREAVNFETLDSFLLPLGAGMVDFPSVSLDGPQVQKIKQGQGVVVSPSIAKGIRGDVVGFIPTILAMHHDEALAICALDGLTLKPLRVFVTD